MTEKTSNGRVRLDWKRLLGFDQVAATPSGSEPVAHRVRLAKVGTKVGSKPGIKSVRSA